MEVSFKIRLRRENFENLTEIIINICIHVLKLNKIKIIEIEI